MTMSFLSPVRTVLLIGDEELCVYKVTHNSAQKIDNIPWVTDGFEEAVADLIRKECGGKPVLIVNDMTDQHFKGGQRLPKVGMMDKGHVLRRKLQVAFPNYPIRGALPMRRERVKGEAGGGFSSATGLYLFAAVPVSEPIIKTMDAVKLSLAPIAGFVLLPVEASDMVKVLSDKLAIQGQGKERSKWVVFIGQHQSGALRQVITRDGQLAMTRMTPISEVGGDPQAWAREVGQEFKATISYLSRFGYSPDEGTDLIVVAEPQAGEAFEKLVDIPCRYNSFTAPEVARLLGMKIGLQQGDSYYADPLHVAWAGRKMKFVLPMEADTITKIKRPRQAVAAAVLLLLLTAAGLGWMVTSKTQNLVITRSDLNDQKAILMRATAEYEKEVARMDALGYDIKLIQGAKKAYDEFDKHRLKILALVEGIGEGVGNDMRIDALKINRLGGNSLARAVLHPDKEQEDPKLEAVLSVSFPPTLPLEDGIREINNLERRLSNTLPNYEVVVTRQVARPEYTQNIQGVASSKKAEDVAAQEDYLAELVIKGPRK